jgi:hypothetical protein
MLRRNEMIVKAEIKITLLMPATSVEDAAATLGQCELNDLVIQLSEEGEWLGRHELMSTKRVLPWDVPGECVGMDAESDFFGVGRG